jgi:hypothetical protein
MLSTLRWYVFPFVLVLVHPPVFFEANLKKVWTGANGACTTIACTGETRVRGCSLLLVVVTLSLFPVTTRKTLLFVTLGKWDRQREREERRRVAMVLVGSGRK